MEGKIKFKACTCQANLKEEARGEAWMAFTFFLERQFKPMGGGRLKSLNRFSGCFLAQQERWSYH